TVVATDTLEFSLDALDEIALWRLRAHDRFGSRRQDGHLCLGRFSAGGFLALGLFAREAPLLLRRAGCLFALAHRRILIGLLPRPGVEELAALLARQIGVEAGWILHEESRPGVR